MASLSDLRPSLIDLLRSESLQVVLSCRASRRISKKLPAAKKQKSPSSKVKKTIDFTKLSEADAKMLLALLGEE